MIEKMISNEKGITRLMVITMLIACIAVAGLVAWVTFSPEEEGQPFYAGPLVGGDALQLRSAIVAHGDGTGVEEVSFTLDLPEGADPVNFNQPPENVVMISYNDGRPQIDDLYWTFAEYGPGDDDNILEAGEKFNITVQTPNPGADAAFEIMIRTPDGKVLTIGRTTPDELAPVMNLR